MDVIKQTLLVRDWPLKKPGDEMFFGYVVALGVFPGDVNDGGEIDDTLVNGLMEYLVGNVEMSGDIGMHGKVWIKLTEKGYEVDLP
jgi:hypothetical protein